jgi:hypothetical protein
MKLFFRLAAYGAIMYGIVVKDYYTASFGCVWLMLQRIHDVEQLSIALISVTPGVQKELARVKAEKEKT